MKRCSVSFSINIKEQYKTHVEHISQLFRPVSDMGHFFGQTKSKITFSQIIHKQTKCQIIKG